MINMIREVTTIYGSNDGFYDVIILLILRRKIKIYEKGKGI